MDKLPQGVEKKGNGYRMTVYCGYDIHGKQIKYRKVWIPPVEAVNWKDETLYKRIEKERFLFNVIEKIKTLFLFSQFRKGKQSSPFLSPTASADGYRRHYFSY